MSSSDTIKRNPPVLNLPQAVALLIVYGRHVVLAMTGNAWFPNPSPPLATVTADLDALEAAEVVAQSRAKGTAKARNHKKKIVQDDLMALKAYAMQIASQHPERAGEIYESAAMALKRYTPRPMPEISAQMGAEPGEVMLRAKAAGRRAAYEWQMSSDGGATWTTIGTTTVADTHVLGLTAGKTYAFRVRKTVKHTTADWSQVISFVVH
jgi:hypothetical protein